MNDKSNMLAGWVLGAGIAALGLSIASGKYFQPEKPLKEGYHIDGAADTGGDGAAAAEPPIAALLQTADVAKGQAIFAKCGACHTANQGGANGIGPNLYGVVGDAVAQGRGGFAFSDALKKVGGKWDFDKLNSWLTSPAKFAPGTKMTFAGLSDEKDRANVIVYLNSMGSNLPLPPPPKAAAPAAGKAGAAPAKDAAKPAAPGAATTGKPAK